MDVVKNVVISDLENYRLISLAHTFCLYMCFAF